MRSWNTDTTKCDCQNRKRPPWPSTWNYSQEAWGVLHPTELGEATCAVMLFVFRGWSNFYCIFTIFIMFIIIFIVYMCLNYFYHLVIHHVQHILHSHSLMYLVNLSREVSESRTWRSDGIREPYHGNRVVSKGKSDCVGPFLQVVTVILMWFDMIIWM